MKKHVLLSSLILLALCSYGQRTFETTYYGVSEDLHCSAAQRTADSGYVMVGTQAPFGGGSQNIFLIKTDSAGNVTNTAEFGGTDFTEGTTMQQTYDGGYIISGHTDDFDDNADDVFLMKTDAHFDTSWTRLHGGFPGYSTGNYVTQTIDSGFAVTGGYNIGGANEGVYFIKADKHGTTVYAQDYEALYEDMEGLCIRQTADKGYIITGFTDSIMGGYDVLLLKIDSAANIVWSKTYGGTGADVGLSVQQTLDSGYIVVGSTSSFGSGNDDIYLIKTNSTGDTLWSKTYGGTGFDEGYSVQQTTDSGYIITGQTTSFGLSLGAAYLVKTDKGGNLLWSKTFPGEGVSVQQLADGYLIGADNGLIKTDANGNTLCDNNPQATIVMNAPTQIKNGLPTFNDYPNDVTPAFQSFYLFAQDNECTPLATHEIPSGENSFSIYPNPAAGKITVHAAYANAGEDVQVAIMNVLGEIIQEEKLKLNDQEEINIEALPQGLYFLQITGKGENWTGRFVKE